MFEKIRSLLANEIGVEEQEITMSSNLIVDLGIESMDLYCIFEMLEEEFGIKIPEEGQIGTVKDLVDVVSKLTV